MKGGGWCAKEVKPLCTSNRTQFSPRRPANIGAWCVRTWSQSKPTKSGGYWTEAQYM